jgi:hypothetical protein
MRTLLLLAVVAGLLPAATNHPVTYEFFPPADATAPIGGTVVFRSRGDAVYAGDGQTKGNASIDAAKTVWRRIRNGTDAVLSDGNGISGSKTEVLRYPVTAADAGAKFYAVLAYTAKGGELTYGPTASPQATLTTVPAGTDLPPQLLTPAAGTQLRRGIRSYFTAQGVGLKWAVKIDDYDPTSAQIEWKAPNDFDGAGRASYQIPVYDPRQTWNKDMKTLTITITDVQNRTATRTWNLEAFENVEPPKVPVQVYGQLGRRGVAQAPGATLFPAARGLLTGVTGHNQPWTVSLVQGPTQAGASVAVNADGSFTATMPAPVLPFAEAGTLSGTPTFYEPFHQSFLFRVTDSKGNATDQWAIVYAQPVQGDANRDGAVNALDLQAVTGAFGSQW